LAKFKLLHGQLPHRFSSEKLKEAIQKALASKNISIDELYDNGQERTCRTLRHPPAPFLPLLGGLLF
jgi:hypothetical protein